MSVLIPPTQVAIRPQRKIADFTAHVTLQETSTDNWTVTQHPVQHGVAITDHVIPEPPTLTISVGWDERDRPLTETYSDMLALANSDIMFDVVTGHRIYDNMRITSITHNVDRETNSVLMLDIGLQQVRVVEVMTVKMPAQSKQNASTMPRTRETSNAGMKQAEQLAPMSKVRLRHPKRTPPAGMEEGLQRPIPLYDYGKRMNPDLD